MISLITIDCGRMSRSSLWRECKQDSWDNLLFFVILLSPHLSPLAKPVEVETGSSQPWYKYLLLSFLASHSSYFPVRMMVGSDTESKVPWDKMQDFLIPTFEQFQYLRELNKAKRQQQKQQQQQQQRVTPTAIIRTAEPDKRVTMTETQKFGIDRERNDDADSVMTTTGRPRMVVVSLPETFLVGSHHKNVDPNEDDSATEIASPLPPPPPPQQQQQQQPSKRRKYDTNQNGTMDNNHDPLDSSRSKADSTSTSTSTRNVGKTTSQIPPLPMTKRNSRDKDDTGPFEKAETSKLESSTWPKSSMPTKQVVLPSYESSPEQDEKDRRPHWFQRKRKRKLQQMRLSFTSGKSES